MKEIGFLFPGQGAQAVGMGQDLYEKADTAHIIFDRANQLLSFQLSELCFHGPDSELTRTVNTQIAIFVTSIAALAALRTTYPQIKPAVACGLSLGEFTALVALDAISFEDGLQLVRKRGELMEEANRKDPGTMASIIGLSISDCELVCQAAGAVIANLNSDDQVVISGSFEAIERACQMAEKRGAKRVISLKVGGAFHSPLMKDAEAGLKEALRKVKIKQPSGSFIPNVTGEITRDPETIRTLLGQQLTRPVQWLKTMECVARNGFIDFLEIGPGRVLKGLAKRIDSKINVHNIEKMSDIEQFKTTVMGPAHAS